MSEEYVNEPYLLVSDQEEDWKPVIKNFVSECALEDLIEIKKVRPLRGNYPVFDRKAGTSGEWVMHKKYGPAETRIVLGAVAKEHGYGSIKTLFNDWFNKRDIFTPEEKPFQ